jgi:hypothetical protein
MYNVSFMHTKTNSHGESKVVHSWEDEYDSLDDVQSDLYESLANTKGECEEQFSLFVENLNKPTNDSLEFNYNSDLVSVFCSIQLTSDDMFE